MELQVPRRGERRGVAEYIYQHEVGMLDHSRDIQIELGYRLCKIPDRVRRTGDPQEVLPA